MASDISGEIPQAQLQYSVPHVLSSLSNNGTDVDHYNATLQMHGWMLLPYHPFSLVFLLTTRHSARCSSVFIHTDHSSWFHIKVNWQLWNFGYYKSHWAVSKIIIVSFERDYLFWVSIASFKAQFMLHSFQKIVPDILIIFCNCLCCKIILIKILIIAKITKIYKLWFTVRFYKLVVFAIKLVLTNQYW